MDSVTMFFRRCSARRHEKCTRRQEQGGPFSPLRAACGGVASGERTAVADAGGMGRERVYCTTPVLAG